MIEARGISEVSVTTKVIISEDGDGFYGCAPAFPGLHVGGETVVEVHEALREGIECYLDSLIKHSDPLPEGVDIEVEARERLT